MRRAVWIAAGLAAVVCGATLLSRPAAVAQGPTKPLVFGASSIAVGVAHEAASMDPWGNPAALQSAGRLLASRPVYQDQRLMGWGVGNPEPSPGVYDWNGLDRRLALIRASGGIPVITLCGAPDWMSGKPSGTTDWTQLGAAPTPAHYQDFADLAAQVARRYPDVHHFLVWSELTGFYDPTLNRWNYEGYTALYNKVYHELKRVNAANQVGGPYAVMESKANPDSTGGLQGSWGSVDHRALDVITYWLAHNWGADFIAVDGSSEPRWSPPVTDEFSATGKFAAVDTWLRQRTSLPIWWSEFYVQPRGSEWTPAHQAAVLSTALGQLATSGASVALVWGPEADLLRSAYRGYLWSNTAVAGGGQASPYYNDFKNFNEAFSSVVVNPTTGSLPYGTTLLAPYQVLFSS
jgi:hypothetical protein